MADARDLKSREHCARGGSIPPLGIYSKQSILWPYRLGVRTGDSQSSNRGSIPRRANLLKSKNKLRSQEPGVSGQNKDHSHYKNQICFEY